MRSRAEKTKQLRNALVASGFSLMPALIAALVSYVCLRSGLVVTLIVSAVTFVIVLAVMIYLWKKTDIIRSVLYSLHCIRMPRSARKYYCPCCNRSIAGFVDMGFGSDNDRFDPSRFANLKQDVICPFCYSAPRQRILACWAMDNRDLLSRSDILYFAPEYSMIKWFRHNKIKPVTADLSDPSADLKLDITNIDLPDASFDVVIANHVLEHVSSYEQALTEIKRILKDNGILIISFPMDMSLPTVDETEAKTPEERKRLFGQIDHVRLFGKDSDTLLASYGFDVSTIDISTMPDNILPVTGPAEYDSNIIFICRA